MLCARLFPLGRVIGKGVRCQNCFERPEQHDFSHALFSEALIVAKPVRIENNEPFRYRMVVI